MRGGWAPIHRGQARIHRRSSVTPPIHGRKLAIRGGPGPMLPLEPYAFKEALMFGALEGPQLPQPLWNG